MTKTKLALASLVAIAVVAIGSASLAQNAYAGDGQCWGKNTKDFAPLGDHSKAGGAAGDPPYDSFLGEPDKPGRVGLGNLMQAFGSWTNLLAFLGFGC